jgi:hypothetical protein
MKTNKRTNWLVWLGTLIIVLGTANCGTAQLPTLAPVGPEPPSTEHIGYLIVYSATEPFNDGDVMYYSHTDYQLYTAKGTFIKTVHNSISRSDETPERIKLPAGQYLIHAQSETDGFVAVPVIIATGRRTVVNLESDRRGANRRSNANASR